MCIITKRGGRGLLDRRQHKEGFTLPELLVSLLIGGWLLHVVGQWAVLSDQSEIRVKQNEQALLLAQTVLAGGTPNLADGWQIEVEKHPCEQLQEQEITVLYQNQNWSFYYVGP